MSTSDPDVLELRLLGPVDAVRSGHALALGGRRQRALLALLLLERGRFVPVDRLVDELWSGTPPAGAASTLRSYVSRLRRVLGDGAVVAGGAAGYALEVDPERVDAFRFERLADAAREELARGAAGRAAARLRGALELWRGVPFAGLEQDGALVAEARRLEELRVRVLEDRIEADLALGAGAALADELEELVREHPYRERLWRQLMLALYRAARQADALAAYGRARTLLRDQLGLEPSEELRQLQRAILQHEVPSAVAEPPPSNLPAAVTSFVGRDAELADLARLLADARLVTLTGIGGAGKTRLALEAAARALPSFPDGVFFVDFSGLADPALVATHAGAALDVREQGEQPIGARLAARLRDEEVLLLLDNVEHLVEACGALAAELLSTAPHVRILATSRAPLGLPGEVDYPVPPLALPRADAGARELAESEAVRLFFARARAARPRLSEDDEALASAARICRDLDGLPLGIELAAARAKALSLDEIAAHLADRFRFLVSWRRLTPARHRTLEQAIEWSYELLAEAERALLRRLAVFVGGFTLDAAAAVCLGGDRPRALELVGRLADASLVVPDEEGGRTRYRLLETVRDYAAARRPDEEEADARRLHADWCIAFAEEAERELTGETQATWFAALEAEHDNLRAALAYLAATGQPALQLRLAVALTRFWYVRGYLSEARGWLDEGLAGDAEQPVDVRRRALTASAALALLQGDYAAATTWAEAVLETARTLDDDRLVANALSNLGAILLAGGEHARAAPVLEDAVALAREVDDERIAALAINNLGDLALTTGDYERAAPLFEESLALLRARGDTTNIARSLFNLGAVALRLARVDEARRRFRESVELSRSIGDKEDLAWCLEGFAALAATEGDGRRAAVLLGSAGALLAQMGAVFKPFERQLHNDTESRARELAATDVDEAMRRGAALTLDEALEVALEGLVRLPA